MNKYLIESIGTFFLVLVVALTGNPLAIGAVLTAMVYMGGPVSGGHYNPAVSLGAWMSKNITGRLLIFYWIAQFIGAIIAGLLAIRVSNRSIAPSLGAGIDVRQGMVVELIFTFALVFVVLNVGVSKREHGNDYFGIATGFILMAGAYAGGPISGGAFNPAVGIALTVTNIFNSGVINSHIRIYLVGPLLGGILAALAYKHTEEHHRYK